MIRSDRPLVNLFLERCREFFREPGILFWTFGFPMLLAIVLSMAFSEGGGEEFAVAVADGPGADALLAAFDGAESIAAERLPADEARAKLGRGAAVVMVEAAAHENEKGPLVFTYDPKRPGAEFAARAVRDALERAAGREDVLAVRTETVTARGQRYIDFLVPGLVGLTVMNGGVWMIGYGLILMRTGKLLKRLYATPMRHSDLLLSFALFRLLIAFVEAFVLLGFGWIVYDLPLPAEPLALVALIGVGSLSFAGLGLLTGSRAQNPQSGAGWVNVSTLPMMLLSGVFFSAENFPDWLQPLVQALPLTALNDGMRSVLNEGAGVAALGGEFAILGAWGLGCFVIALKVFRWT